MFSRVLLTVLVVVASVFSQYSIGGSILGPTTPGVNFKINFKGSTFTGSIIATSGLGGCAFSRTFPNIWLGTTSIQAVTPGYRFSPDSFPNDTLGRLGNGAVQTIINHTFHAYDTAKPVISNISVGKIFNLGDTATLSYRQTDNSNIIASKKISVGYTSWILIDSVLKTLGDSLADTSIYSNRTLKFAPSSTGLFKMKIVLTDKDGNSATAYSDTFRVIPKSAPVFQYTKNTYAFQKTAITALDSIMIASVVGPVDSFVLTPKGVDGLTIDQNGTITGTVSKASQKYIIFGYNAAGFSTDTITITYTEPVIKPPVFTYTKNLYTVGTIITTSDSIRPSSITGTVDSFTLTAPGYDIKNLIIDKKTGVITGSVAAIPNQVLLTIKATNAGGSNQVMIRLVITSTGVVTVEKTGSSKIALSGKSINYNGFLSAEIYNFKGQIVLKLAGKNCLVLPNMHNGPYLLKVQSESDKLIRVLQSVQ